MLGVQMHGARFFGDLVDQLLPQVLDVNVFRSKSQRASTGCCQKGSKEAQGQLRGRCGLRGSGVVLGKQDAEEITQTFVLLTAVILKPRVQQHLRHFSFVSLPVQPFNEFRGRQRSGRELVFFWHVFEVQLFRNAVLGQDFL